MKTKTKAIYTRSPAGEKQNQSPEQRCERPWLLHFHLGFHLGFCASIFGPEVAPESAPGWLLKMPLAGREAKLPKQYACPCAARCPASSIRPDAQQEGQRPGKSRRNHQQHVNAGPVSVSNSSRNSGGSEIPEQLPKLHWLPSLLFPFLFRCPVTLCVCFCVSPL